jgi:hypothetical protein
VNASPSSASSACHDRRGDSAAGETQAAPVGVFGQSGEVAQRPQVDGLRVIEVEGLQPGQPGERGQIGDRRAVEHQPRQPVQRSDFGRQPVERVEPAQRGQQQAFRPARARPGDRCHRPFPPVHPPPVSGAGMPRNGPAGQRGREACPFPDQNSRKGLARKPESCIQLFPSGLARRQDRDQGRRRCAMGPQALPPPR